MAETSGNSGLLLDLDKGEGKVSSGRIYDQISFPCSTLEISFSSETMAVFEKAEGEYYFRFCGMDWVPYDNSFGVTNEGTYQYTMCAFPKTMYKTITKPAKNAAALARAMGLKLTEDSENLDLKCPIVNLSAYELIMRHRLVSLQDAYAKGDMGEAVFIYCNSEAMYCAKWSTMCKKKKRELQFTSLEGQNVMKTLLDSRIESDLCAVRSPKPWIESDYLARMTGLQFQFLIPKNVAFCENYTIKFEDDDSFDIPVPMLCTYQSVDLLDSSKFSCVFTQVNLAKREGQNG